LGSASPQEQTSSHPKRTAFETIDRNAEQIATVGDVLYYFGEPGMQEHESSKYLKETLEDAGFKVELGGAGMPTNVWATWGSGNPVIAIVTEMDALREGSQTPGSIPRKPLVEGAPGHMEGHNVMAAVAVGAAHAVKKTMEQHKISGSIVISIGPAEEQLMSRPYLVRDGYFKNVDAAVLTHIGDRSATGYGLQNYALIGAKFTFKGRTAHGGVNPWDGKDAVDAVVLIYWLRQAARAFAPDLSRAPHDHQWRRSPQHHPRLGSDLVVRSRCNRTLGEREFR
jgi:aminobenzoyl-glutamate utilization protein B